MDLDKPEASTSQTTLESRLEASLAREAQLSTSLHGVIDYLDRANEALPSASQLPHSVLNLLANLHSALLLSSSPSSSALIAGRNETEVLQVIQNLVEENEALYQLLSTGSYSSLYEQIQKANQKISQFDSVVDGYKSLVQDLELEVEQYYAVAQQKASPSKAKVEKWDGEENGVKNERKRKSPSPSMGDERRERRRSRSADSRRTRRSSVDRDRQRERDHSDRHRDDERSRRHEEDRRSRRRDADRPKKDDRAEDRSRIDEPKRRDASPPPRRRSRDTSRHRPVMNERNEKDQKRAESPVRATKRPASAVPDKKPPSPVASKAASPIRTKVLPASIDQALPTGPKASRLSVLSAPTGPRARRDDEHEDKRPRSTSGTVKEGSSRLFSAAVGSSSRGISIKGAAKS